MKSLATETARPPQEAEGARNRDFLEYIYQRHIRPDDLPELQEARLHAQIAGLIYDLRTSRGLTQKQLAQMVGTQASAISRLEDADYGGHSLSMLERIAEALGLAVRVTFEEKGTRGASPRVEAVEREDGDGDFGPIGLRV